MKVTNLMVGDWVNIKGKPVKVTLDDLRTMLILFEDVDFHIEPIPLTEDILLKNGFRYTANVIGRHNCKCYELEQKGVYHMTISIYKNKITCELDKVDALYMNVVTNCVHELQHLLRLVGVQKEIEL